MSKQLSLFQQGEDLPLFSRQDPDPWTGLYLPDEEPPDHLDEFEDADWGDGSISPEEELRRAALDHRGQP